MNVLSRVLGGAAVAAVIAFPAAGSGADIGKGKVLYDVYCAQCHGTSGTGKGANAPHLAVQPRNHTDRAEMSARSDAELFKAIKHGGQAVNKSVLMPNWDGNLSDDEINELVVYLRHLCCEDKK